MSNNITSNKEINIEKYDINEWEKEQKPYAMILTDVIQRVPPSQIKAAFLWIYLESLPSTWILNKQHIKKHFGISDKTYERWISWLNATGLIEYRQSRNCDGSFGKGCLIVLNGTKFNPSADLHRTVKIDGTVVNRSNSKQIVHDNRTAILPSNGDAVATANDGHINTTTIRKEKKNEYTTTGAAAPIPAVVVNNVFSFKDDSSIDHLTEIEEHRLKEAYEKNPVITENIRTVIDFLSCALFCILNRDSKYTRQQRLSGIVKFLQNGTFEENHEWGQIQIREKNRKIGESKAAFIEKLMQDKAKADLKSIESKRTPAACHDLLVNLTGDEDYKERQRKKAEQEKREQEDFRARLAKQNQRVKYKKIQPEKGYSQDANGNRM